MSLRCAPEPSASPAEARGGPAADATSRPPLRSLGHSRGVLHCSVWVCALGQGLLGETPPSPGLAPWLSATATVRAPEGDAGRRPRVRAEERFRSDVNGHPAVARTHENQPVLQSH